MARILAYTSPARGHLMPATAVLLELAARGHEVGVVGLADEVGRLRSLGLDAEPLDPAVEAVTMDDWQSRGARARFAGAVSVFARRAEFEVADLRRTIDRHRPDALLVDVNAWGAVAATQEWGGPWASFCPFPLPVGGSAGVPPFGPGLAPMTGLVGRGRDAVARPLVVGMVERVALPPANAVRARLGLAPLGSVDDLYLAAPVVLSMTAEPFEYHRSQWPDQVELVGPCEWEPEEVGTSWVDDLEGPIVLVTTSSERQDDDLLARVAAEAFGDRPGTVVLTLPSGHLAGTTLPRNVRAERFVPHGLLLDRAAVAVTHGGMGATQKALGRGVPVCAVPFGRDQLEVAARVVHSGAGTRLLPRRLTAERLRDAVRRASACTPGAARVAEGFAAAGGAHAAADAMERRVLSDVPRPPIGG